VKSQAVALKRVFLYLLGTALRPTGRGKPSLMARVALTDRMILHAKANGVPQADFFDEKEPGLALRVSAGGRKSWCFFYTRPGDGKRARITVGTYPALSLAGARAKAVEARGWVQAGHDPKSFLAGQGAAGMTVAGLIAAYLTDPEKAARRSAAEVARRLAKNVTPIIGGVRLTELRRRDVRNVTDVIVHRGKLVEAVRVWEDVRGLVRWAVDREFLEVDPIAGMAKPTDGSTPSERVLSDEEVATLWNGLPTALARSRQCQLIIKLCLATAQRVGEVAGLPVSELDLRTAEWHLPPERAKNGHAHSVPLSEMALELIEQARAEMDGSPFLFPCAGGSLSPVAVARTILRANEVTSERPFGRFGIASWSAHDLRRTAITGMARLGVAPVVLGFVANHRTTTRAGVTLAHYVRHSYDREKREALDLWAARLRAITDGRPSAQIVSLRG
jgi:integrase